VRPRATPARAGRTLAVVLLAVGGVGLVLGLLAGANVILMVTKPAAQIAFPAAGGMVGRCEEFRGESTGVPDDKTLVLTVRDQTSGQTETYLSAIRGWDTGRRPESWSSTIFFNTVGHTYDVRVYLVDLGDVRSDLDDPRNRPIWHKPAIPDEWGHPLAQVSVVGRAGPGPASCMATG
jgi:hypothetical protein